MPELVGEAGKPIGFLPVEDAIRRWSTDLEFQSRLRVHETQVDARGSRTDTKDGTDPAHWLITRKLPEVHDALAGEDCHPDPKAHVLNRARAKPRCYFGFGVPPGRRRMRWSGHRCQPILAVIAIHPHHRKLPTVSQKPSPGRMSLSAPALRGSSRCKVKLLERCGSPADQGAIRVFASMVSAACARPRANLSDERDAGPRQQRGPAQPSLIR